MTHVYMFVGMPVFALDYSILPIAAAVVGGPGTLAAPLWERRSSCRSPKPCAGSAGLRIVFYGCFSGRVHRRPSGRHLPLRAAQIPSIRNAGWRWSDGAAAFLRVDSLSKNFGGVQAITDLSFELAEGELLGLIGPNGSGKTTAVNLITGFVKPSKGAVVYRGRDITGLAPHAVVRLGISRTFQMVKPFYHLPAYKNMIIPFTRRGPSSWSAAATAIADAVALDLLEEVGFERDSQVAYKSAAVLPQGYLKRLELAKAIALKPDLIILDELFSGLSLAEVASIVPIIEKLRQEGKTIIMIEHRLKELFRIADGSWCSTSARKIAEGRAQEVMASEDVKKAYLGVEA